jgi:hypothetical protein
MALSQAEIMALEAGTEADAQVSRVAGHRLDRPTTRYPTAFQLENEVEIDGYQRQYVGFLQDVVLGNPGGPKWRLLHATPLERCKAYLLLYDV